MTWKRLLIAVMFCLGTIVETGQSAAAAGGELRVMTFNIRYANPKDGDNVWPLRKELLFSTIEAFGPDLLGLQEVLTVQADEIKTRLAGYEMLGVGRNDGKSDGERASLLFKTDRFEKVRSGDFWLSETPDKVGSKGWDAQLPRICSWVELRDKKADGRPLVFFNTHWDHMGVKAREQSAKLMNAKIREIAGDKPVVVTGDFNTSQTSEPYKVMLRDGLVDAYAAMHPDATLPQATFHGFTGKPDPRGARIDWVLHSKEFRTTSAEIDRTSDKGRYPSDHFPVKAVLQWSP